MEEIRVLSPTGILGYGFPAASLDAGMARKPHVIAVDGGSTDGGPYYLGVEPGVGAGGQAGAFREFIARDLGPLLQAAIDAEIPLIIGSAGFAGANLHLAGAVALLQMAAAERKLRFRMATIRAEVDKQYVKDKLAAGAVEPLGPAPALTPEAVDASVRFVAQMGVEPFLEALDRGAQVIVAGRANDPSMFAAIPFREGFDKGLALHMAKILECGAIAADPGSGSDVLLGTLRRDHFVVEPTNPDRRCTVQSVAAHSLYEKSDPHTLYSPGGRVDLTEVGFAQETDRSVRVTGSRYVPDPVYRVKIEGSRRVGFRTIAVAGIRDPAAIAHLDELLDHARAGVRDKFGDADYQLVFHVYGRDGVMGELETYAGPPPHELGLVFEVVAPDQGLATSICGQARSVVLHAGFGGRRSTAGNLAFPFSPLDIPAGPVYAFSAYHLVEEPDPLRLFPVEVTDL